MKLKLLLLGMVSLLWVAWVLQGNSPASTPDATCDRMLPEESAELVFSWNRRQVSFPNNPSDPENGGSMLFSGAGSGLVIGFPSWNSQPDYGVVPGPNLLFVLSETDLVADATDLNSLSPWWVVFPIGGREDNLDFQLRLPEKVEQQAAGRVAWESDDTVRKARKSDWVLDARSIQSDFGL